MLIKLLFRGEGLPSPFILLQYILIFLNICLPQVGTEEILHPFKMFVQKKDSTSFIQIINKSHFGIINPKDSLTLMEKGVGIRYSRKIDKGELMIKLLKKHSISEFIKPNYAISLQKNYKNIQIEYEMYGKYFNIKYGIHQYSLIKGISPSFLLAIKLKPNFIINVGKSNNKIPFNIFIRYLDFSYYLNDMYSNYETNHFGINFNGERYKIKYELANTNNSIKPIDLTTTKYIESENGEMNKIFFEGKILLNGNSRLMCIYNNNFRDGSFNLINNSGQEFLKINNYQLNSRYLKIEYRGQINKIKVIVSGIKQRLNIGISSRIYPSRISQQLSSLFGLIINNKDIAELDQNSVFIKIKPIQFIKFCPVIQIGLVSDKYSNNLNTKGYSIGILNFIDENKLSITGKNALNVNFGINYKKNRWQISTYFSQHIILSITRERIEKDENLTPEESGDFPALQTILSDFDNVLTLPSNYGGGLFHFTLTRYLD